MNSDVVAAYVGTGVAALLAVLSLVVASRANRRADQANAIAATANVLAGEANQHAAEAVGLAKAAEERADKLARVQLERADVDWEQGWDDVTKTLWFNNVGADDAFDVEIHVDQLSTTFRLTSEPRTIVRPAERTGIRLDVWARAAADRWDAIMNDPASSFIPTPGFQVRARLTWRSEEGVPGVKEWAELSL